MDDCDYLVGVKEVDIDCLIPGKNYFMFAHVAKMPGHNRPLLLAMMDKRITLFDYEYLVDGNLRAAAPFSWWAGVAGVYYTLMGYGLKYHLYDLPKPGRDFTMDQMLGNLRGIDLPKVKLFITGGGSVSKGACFVLDKIGAVQMSEQEYLNTQGVNHLSYAFGHTNQLVKRCDGKPFSYEDFNANKEEYESDFMKWANTTDILICAHYWSPGYPVFLNEDELKSKSLRIKMIGDVACDVGGSIKSTLRDTTHDDPFYDYNPNAGFEEPAFSSDKNITVMAVDALPNALARDSSEDFGKMLTPFVFEPLFTGGDLSALTRAKILDHGYLTEPYGYLKTYEGK